MQISNADQNSRSDDPVWFFLGEYSLEKLVIDGDIGDGAVDGLLFQTVRGLGIQPECVENMGRTLTGVTIEALLYFRQGRTQVPEQIRVFCQKKIIDDANSMRAVARPEPTKPPIEPAQMALISGTQLVRGWGYFLIERGADFPPGSSANPRNCVDLYLYREGETKPYPSTNNSCI